MTLEPGTSVSVQRLSELYGVSRTPVREAIVRLQQSGLLEVYPQRKTVVSKIDLKRVCEELFIRTSLESAVADKFIRRCSQLVIDTMQELINKQKKYTDKEHFTEFYNKENYFHKLIFDTADQELSWNTIENVATHYNRVRILNGKINGAQSIIDEHEKMIAAIRKGNSESLRKAITEYSDNLQDQIKVISKQNPKFFSKNFQQQ